MHPLERPPLLTSFPKGHKASPANFNVCIPKGIPTIVSIINILEIKYSTAVKIPPSNNHNKFIKQPISISSNIYLVFSLLSHPACLENTDQLPFEINQQKQLH